MTRLSKAMATRYVDPQATGSNSGTSWADAWTSLGAMSGLAPGDTVYISGGPSGSTQVYDMDANGRPYPNFTTLNGFRNGTAGNRIVYTIGQDSAHNGKAIFSTTRGNHFLFKPKYIEFVGDAGDGEMHFALSGFSDLLVGDDSIAVRVAYFDCGEIGRFISCNSCTQMEVDHCYAQITDIHTPFAAYLLYTGSGFDAEGGGGTCPTAYAGETTPTTNASETRPASATLRGNEDNRDSNRDVKGRHQSSTRLP